MWGCARESEVENAARSGQWTEGLRAHARTCAVCRDVMLVAGMLHHAARRHVADRPVPDPGRVWWIAQLRARQARTARATRPIAIVEKLALTCGLLVIAGLVAWAWPTLADWGTQVRTAWALTAASSLGPMLNTLLLAGGTLLAFLLWFAVFFTHAED